MTRENIIGHLKNIEMEYDVKIIYAVESGSRSWGFESPDSDWDVRFVYVHPLKWYLKVEPGRDVIEVVDNDGFDASGWDIRKTLSLFGKTNPSIIEWINSPIVYVDTENFSGRISELMPLFFNAKKAMYHYYHIALNHDERYLQKRGKELKRYLYYLRGLLASKWILKYGTPPPVLMRELVNAIVDDSDILEEINHILTLKSTSKEHDKDIIYDALQAYGNNLKREVEMVIESENIPAEKRELSLLDSLSFDIIKRG